MIMTKKIIKKDIHMSPFATFLHMLLEKGMKEKIDEIPTPSHIYITSHKS